MTDLEYLQNLVVMALADGQFSQEEIDFLTDRCLEMGFNRKQLNSAIRYAFSDSAVLHLPQNPTSQRRLLGDLIRMMAADGHLHEREKRLFAVAAAIMQFEAEQIDPLIDEVLARHG